MPVDLLYVYRLGTTNACALTGEKNDPRGFFVSPRCDPGTGDSRPLDHTSVLHLLADRYAGGLYSPEVHDRQPSLSRLSDAITRTAPRTDLPQPPSVEAVAVASPTLPRRAPGANANAAAFRLAAAKIAADHPGIAGGWPALMLAARP
jgi:hypothetical protein